MEALQNFLFLLGIVIGVGLLECIKLTCRSMSQFATDTIDVAARAWRRLLARICRRKAETDQSTDSSNPV